MPIRRRRSNSDQDGSEQGNGDGFETEQAGHDRADDAAETLSAAEEAEERRDPVDQDENGRDDVDESGDDNGYSAEALGAEAPEDENGEADGNGEPVGEEQVVEDLGGGDALEEVSERRHRPVRRHYKIQEVIKRRQILLVQVVKEERGNKGAAMTTYLSLAGRYSVLMPNTARGGGISRKITSAEDRKRLKEVAQDLEVPQGMGIILRTAGASRTKPEIKRDYEYLMRLWESVRELTLKSSAPALVYEEGSLIKRAIRDLYNKEIDEILVAGEEGYREAKDFMRMLMPSHAKAVQLYKEEQPLFAKYGIEAQLDAMFSSQVQLKSGGYLVINPTEALVSIDVNSGRSTREHNIEDTALRTNLEASEEIARQLRLRDLAGLIVIDFIDMEEKRNNRAVEKRLKDSLKNDRARIQVGHISPFGLMEMSRQRIRTGVLESSSIPCPHCAGTGVMRATPSVALHLLRTLEETLIRSAAHNLVVRTREEAAFYVLNHKRTHLHDLESRFGVRIDIVPDGSLSGMTVFAVDRGEPATRIERKAPATGVQIDAIAPLDETDSEIDESGDEMADADADADAATETNGMAGAAGAAVGGGAAAAASCARNPSRPARATRATKASRTMPRTPTSRTRAAPTMNPSPRIRAARARKATAAVASAAAGGAAAGAAAIVTRPADSRGENPVMRRLASRPARRPAPSRLTSCYPAPLPAGTGQRRRLRSRTPGNRPKPRGRMAAQPTRTPRRRPRPRPSLPRRSSRSPSPWRSC